MWKKALLLITGSVFFCIYVRRYQKAIIIKTCKKNIKRYKQRKPVNLPANGFRWFYSYLKE